MKKMRITVIVGVCIIGAVFFAGCKNGNESAPAGEVRVTGVTLQTVPDTSSATDKRTSYIWLGAADTVSKPASLVVVQTLTPANATNNRVTFEFSGDEFADWNPVGNIVTAKKAGGAATVTVTTEDGGFMAVHNIRVLAAGESVPR